MLTTQTYDIEDVTKASTGSFKVYVDYFYILSPEGKIQKATTLISNPHEAVCKSILHLFPEGSYIQQIPIVYIPLEILNESPYN